MKRLLILLMAVVAAMPLYAQVGEKNLNRRYFNDVRDSLNNEMLARQRNMQRYAQNALANLPNDEKLYDESYISVTAELVGDATAGEDTRFDLVYRLSYNCKHIEGYTDDYPLGAYDVDSSNSCRAICNLTKHFLENDLRHLITPGKEVEITISSSADGTEFTTSVPYFGQYGDFRYCPVTFNGERLRVSVDRTTGINNNCQLAYIRAQAIRAWMEENIPVLHQTANNFNFVAQSYKDSTHVHYYRRSSVEIRVLDVEREVFERSIADKRMDEYVDYNIRKTNIKNSDAYVLIIANEDYAGALMPKVSYAANDGDVLQRYFVRSLGVPERQVKVLHNASKEEILNEGIHWLTDLSQAVAVKNGDQAAPLANLFIYYAGLGFTDLNGAAYLVPNNVKTDDIKSLNPQNSGGCKLFGCGKKNKTHDTVNYDVILSKKDCSRLTPRLLGVEELCGAFKNYPVKNLTLILDASFDGNNRDGKPHFRVERKIDTKKKKRKANMRSDAVVLLAAEYDKTAFSFDDQQHGFLTYFLLKEIKSQQDNIFSLTYQDIYESIERKLNKESALQNRWQEISGLAGGKYKDSWQHMRIK